jgi:hypothetical protein
MRHQGNSDRGGIPAGAGEHDESGQAADAAHLAAEEIARCGGQCPGRCDKIGRK